MPLTIDGVSHLLAKVLLRRLSEESRPLIVGVDGADCSGKSTLSKHLVHRLKRSSSVVLVHFDDYVNIDVRDSQDLSVDLFRDGYFDREALIRSVLKPAALQKHVRSFPTFDFIIVEGLFLLEQEVRYYLDISIRLEIDEELAFSRAVARDVGIIGPHEWVVKHYREQCLPAQRLYRADVRPDVEANFVVRVYDRTYALEKYPETPQ
jgi:uridine kinase